MKFLNKVKSLVLHIATSKSFCVFSFIFTILLSIAVIIFGFLAETKKLPLFDNLPLSEFMSRCFKEHKQFKDTENYISNYIYANGYTAYYIILYCSTILYLTTTVIICATTKKISWCAYALMISIIFLVFINAYLTEMLQYGNENNAIYQTYSSSFISVTTILSGIAGIKLSILFNKPSKRW